MPSVPGFILASASPRRRELLERAGYVFTVCPSTIVEPPPDGFESPAAYVSHTAWRKATQVGAPAGRWVLGADTVVALGPGIIGKPADRADAERILRLLGGTRHQVVTGLCLFLPRLGTSLVTAETTTVEMRLLTDAEIADYLESGRWRGKAGAYGIQDHGDPCIASVDGSFTNVMGLPVERVRELFTYAGRLDPGSRIEIGSVA